MNGQTCCKMDVEKGGLSQKPRATAQPKSKMSFLSRCGTILAGLLLVSKMQSEAAATTRPRAIAAGRERVSLNDEWRFQRFVDNPDGLSYDVLKPWILPAANPYLSGAKHERPSAPGPGSNITFVQPGFDDAAWEGVNLPHDWAASGELADALRDASDELAAEVLATAITEGEPSGDVASDVELGLRFALTKA